MNMFMKTTILKENVNVARKKKSRAFLSNFYFEKIAFLISGGHGHILDSASLEKKPLQ